MSSAPLYDAKTTSRRYSYYRTGSSNLAEDEKFGLIRKVYGILFFQLVVTFSIAFFASGSQVGSPVFNFFNSSGLLIGSLIFLLISAIVVFACYQIVPINYIATLFFTLSMALFISCITCLFDRDTVLLAIGITLAVAGGVTILSLFISEVVIWAYVLMIFILTLMVYLVVLLILTSPSYDRYGSRGLFSLYCSLYAMIFAIYIAIDAQIVASGLEVDEYIVGAVMIYIHIIYLFLYILMAVAAAKK